MNILIIALLAIGAWLFFAKRDKVLATPEEMEKNQKDQEDKKRLEEAKAAAIEAAMRAAALAAAEVARKTSQEEAVAAAKEAAADLPTKLTIEGEYAKAKLIEDNPGINTWIVNDAIATAKAAAEAASLGNEEKSAQRMAAVAEKKYIDAIAEKPTSETIDAGCVDSEPYIAIGEVTLFKDTANEKTYTQYVEAETEKAVPLAYRPATTDVSTEQNLLNRLDTQEAWLQDAIEAGMTERIAEGEAAMAHTKERLALRGVIV